MLQKITQLLQNFQRQLASRQKLIITLFLIAEGAVVASVVLIANATISNPKSMFPLMSEFSSNLGTASLLLFCATLIPGIISRFRWHNQLVIPIVSLMTLFRRHLGILMFVTAAAHMVLKTYVPNFIFTGSPIPTKLPPNFVLFGTAAWFVLLPVWLSSNDTSKRFLGRKWKILQRLTYVAMWFIFAHVALQGESLAIIVGAIAVLEVASWIYFKRNKPLLQPEL